MMSLPAKLLSTIAAVLLFFVSITTFELTVFSIGFTTAAGLLIVLLSIVPTPSKNAIAHEPDASAARPINELEVVVIVSQELRSAQNKSQLMSIVLDQVVSFGSMEGAAIAIRNEKNGSLEFELGWGDWSNWTGIKLFDNEGISGRVIATGEPYISDDIDSESLFERPGLAGKLACATCVPLSASGRMIGVLWAGRTTPLSGDALRILNTITDIAANAIHRISLHEQLSHAYSATIEGWARALDLRDRETMGHTMRVADITVQLARMMQMNEQELENIRRGALLHDIGKMGIPDSVLFKPASLDKEEFDVMRKHPEYAYEMLSHISYLRCALDIPYCHHEKWDGTGYPRGLKGSEIPLSARIFAVVDVWDALCSDRPYRKAWPKEKVREYISSLAGTHFDEKVVERFLQLETAH